MKQELTPQDKLNLLYLAGTKRVNITKKEDGHLDSGGICSCCGIFSIADTGETAVYRKMGLKGFLNHFEYGNKMILTKSLPDQPIPTAELGMCIVIPDETGNVLIEWEDE